MTAVIDGDDLGRSLRRMAHEIVENTPAGSDVVVLGILTRGAALAERLHGLLASLGMDVDLGVLDTAPHRDDRGPEQRADRTEAPGSLDGHAVILVDDVLYTGRTIRAALDALLELGRPARVQVAVLVDRGHRELPIRADYVGRNLPTSPDQRVGVRLVEIDGDEGVWIEGPSSVVKGAGR